MLRVPGNAERCVPRNASLAAVLLLLVTVAVARGADPEVVYSNVLSEFGTIQPHDIVADASGTAYVLAARPGSNYATLVLKLDALGGVVWSRWIDGSRHDIPGGIALDSAGDVYVVGTTGSDDFPTLNALQAAPASVQYDAFVVKLSGQDGAILYSTYFGASRSEWGRDIAVNSAGEIFITGSTESVDFPTVSPIQAELAGYPYWGWSDAYVAKISADGSQLLYSTFLGGYFDDGAYGIALGPDGRMYIAGETDSDDFPTAFAAQSTAGGDGDAFVTRLSADGSAVEYSTYLGGEDIESTRAITLGHDGRVYVAGHSQSIGLPTTAGAYQEDFVGAILGCEVPFGADYNCSDSFVASLEPDGTMFHYVSYLGGHRIDQAYGLAVDAGGRAYVSGHTRSDDFPPYTNGTFYTNFVTKLGDSGSDLSYSFLHNTVTPSPAYVAVDALGDLYVAATNDTPTVLVVMRLSECGAGVPGDLNCDAVVDQKDVREFGICLAGPTESCPAGCERADVNASGSVDLSDFAGLQTTFESP